MIKRRSVGIKKPMQWMFSSPKHRSPFFSSLQSRDNFPRANFSTFSDVLAVLILSFETNKSTISPSLESER